MNIPEESQSVFTSFETLISQSIGLYLEIESLYQTIQTTLSATAVLNVMQTVGTLNALLQEVGKVDDRIAKALNSDQDLSTNTTNLLQERHNTIARLSRTNQHIANKANNIKSLLRHEIGSMSTSHKAMKCYKPSNTVRNHIVQKSY